MMRHCLLFVIPLALFACGPGARVSGGGIAMSGAAYVPSGTQGGLTTGVRYREYSGPLARGLARVLLTLGSRPPNTNKIHSDTRTTYSSGCYNGVCGTYKITTTTVTDSRTNAERAQDAAYIEARRKAISKELSGGPVGIETTVDYYSSDLGGDTDGFSYYALAPGNVRILGDSFALNFSGGIGVSRMTFRDREQSIITGNVGGGISSGQEGMSEGDETVWYAGIPLRMTIGFHPMLSIYSQLDINLLTPIKALTAEDGEALPPTPVRFGVLSRVGPLQVGLGTISNSLDVSSTSFFGEVLVGW